MPRVFAVKNLRRIKGFSPPGRKERKGKQDVETCLQNLSVLTVFAVKIFSLPGSQVPLFLAFFLNALVY